MAPIIPVIMCGGSGTRLWPASRETMPKQFIPLFGDLSTFQMTALRFRDDKRFTPPVVIAHDDFRFIIAEQLRLVEMNARIVLEPDRRDSAAAVAVAALIGAQSGPDAKVAVMAADHLIENAAGFRDACARAAEAAGDSLIMTLGLKPTFPATGYGYIRPGRPIGNGDGAEVSAFVEKPDAEKAKRYIEEGYLWNSGNFVFSADAMLRELRAHAPAILAAATKALDHAHCDLGFTRLDREHFITAPKTSIDFAVMEKTSHAGVLPVSFDWSDIGGWSAVWSALPHDEAGNATIGDVALLDARNCLVHSEDILTTVVGMENALVITTRDAVLVTTQDKADQVKTLVEGLKKRDRSEATQHVRVHRPWGWYQRIDIGPRFQVKRIMVKPGGVLSLQKHFHRAEHWVVVHGTAEVTRDSETHVVRENESIYLPLGCVHRMANPGKIPLEIIEVQVGSYTGEDDIVRIEDVYKRS
ncbi:MAG: mannose-1-phosphate guanylyltransferase/mannose-6-phosphate isomerase [Rhizobiales bacterium 65-9]|nr:mannose-1-phosphate guanylyltransferase/mannose-6-phosphate isomerase [Hyphomicrobiales bacterium]OJY38036.1 MAG: mannose-1-phosphate guanylyltransferase/mannose-6-phosphate isomerase [Rhizobiales bacterium 65-9]